MRAVAAPLFQRRQLPPPLGALHVLIIDADLIILEVAGELRGALVFDDALEAAPCPTREATIEIELAGAVVRVGSGLDDTKRLAAVLRAVRASASRA